MKYFTLFITFIIYFFNVHTPIKAACPGNFRGDGSITFYWKENAEDRAGQLRNWGKSEETFDKNTYSKLPIEVDPKYIYAYQVTGDCCWKIYNRHGDQQTFRVGESKTPEIAFISKIQSIECKVQTR